MNFITNVKAGVLFALFFSTLSVHVQAQSPSFLEQSHYWLSVGLGKTEFPSGMVALGFEPVKKNTVVTARYSISGEIFPGIEPSIKVNELGLLYGIKVGKFRFSTGLSTVWGNNRGLYLFTNPDPLIGSGATYQYLGYKTIGVPGEIRFLTSSKYAGIGITGFGNLNQKRSFLGLNLSVYLGKMQKRGLPDD